MLSFQSLVAQIGGLLGSVLLGFTAGGAGIPVAWLVGGVVVVSSSLGFVYLRAMKVPRRESERPNDQIVS
jgi:hypothetical protein